MPHCGYCQDKIGFFRKVCVDCARLVEAFGALEKEGSFGYTTLLDVLIDTGVSEKKIDCFLETDPDGSGSIRNKVTARMTNEVMTALGYPVDMKAKQVKEIRSATPDHPEGSPDLNSCHHK